MTRTRRSIVHLLGAAMLVGFAAASCSGIGQETVRRQTRTSVERAPAPPRASAVGTRLWGYVLRGDKQRAAGVTVGTEPQTSFATTDTEGHWEIRDRLAPGRYKIVARDERTRESGTVLTEIEVQNGKENVEPIVVVMGRSEIWPWPEDSILPKLPKMPERCYPRCQ